MRSQLCLILPRLHDVRMTFLGELLSATQPRLRRPSRTLPLLLRLQGENSVLRRILCQPMLLSSLNIFQVSSPRATLQTISVFQMLNQMPQIYGRICITYYCNRKAKMTVTFVPTVTCDLSLSMRLTGFTLC